MAGVKRDVGAPNTISLPARLAIGDCLAVATSEARNKLKIAGEGDARQLRLRPKKQDGCRNINDPRKGKAAAIQAALYGQVRRLYELIIQTKQSPEIFGVGQDIKAF